MLISNRFRNGLKEAHERKRRRNLRFLSEKSFVGLQRNTLQTVAKVTFAERYYVIIFYIDYFCDFFRTTFAPYGFILLCKNFLEI